MAKAPKCKICGREHWGNCGDPGGSDDGASWSARRPNREHEQPTPAKPSRDAPVTNSPKRDDAVTRTNGDGGTVIDAHGCVGYYVSCACGCGEDVYVPIREQYASRAHKQRAYRQRRAQP